jgi:hypothetical protein
VANIAISRRHEAGVLIEPIAAEYENGRDVAGDAIDAGVKSTDFLEMTFEFGPIVLLFWGTTGNRSWSSVNGPVTHNV